jgi:transcription-repair coupling factor (superfamily II helicase)
VGNPESPYFQSPVFDYILEATQTTIKNVRLKHIGTNMIMIVDLIKNIDEIEMLFLRLKRPAENQALAQSSETNSSLE